MNGCLIPGTPIVVDFWKIRECGTGKLFFLTHLHGDHIVGLTSSWNHPIYCSPITAKLLDRRYHINTSLIEELEENECHVISAGDGKYITVTVIDAIHCPGAVMFLFEGDFGKILYTGDFRFSSKMTKSSHLSEHLGSIDIVYLDNTYCSPKCDFLTQEEATQSILTIIRRFPKHNIVFGMRNLGKEQLLVNIALELKEWIAVPGRTMEVASLLDMPDVFVLQDDAPDCRLRVAPFQTVSIKQLSSWNDEKPTIGILPSALYTGMGEMRPTFCKSTHRFIVPYSDHSSYSELMQFVACIRPKRVIPIVKASAKGPCGLDLTERANMSCFDHLLSTSPLRTIKRRKLYDPQSARMELFTDNKGTVLHDESEGEKSMVKSHRRILKRKSRVKVVKGVSFTDSPSKIQLKTMTAHTEGNIVENMQDKSNKLSQQNLSFNNIGSDIQPGEDAMRQIYQVRDEMSSDIPVSLSISSAAPLTNKTKETINQGKPISSSEDPDLKKKLDREDMNKEEWDIKHNRNKDNNTELDTLINRSSPRKTTGEHSEFPQGDDIVFSHYGTTTHSKDQESNANFRETCFPSVKRVLSAYEQRRSLYNSLERWYHIGRDVNEVFLVQPNQDIA